MNDTMKLPGQQEQSTIVVMSNKERMKDRFLRNGRTEEWKVNQSLAAETDHIIFVSREILVDVYQQTDLLRILCVHLQGVRKLSPLSQTSPDFSKACLSQLFRPGTV